MPLLERFLDSTCISLKVCGVRSAEDARSLVNLGVEALGVNFWHRSKRYLDPATADWLISFRSSLLRVGVFVNPEPRFALDLVEAGLIDVIQLHGDESPDDALPYLQAGVPFFKAIGVSCLNDANAAAGFHANAVLLDAHAPGVYGGTGATFNWDDAVAFQKHFPDLPLLLAGGITPENALQACRHVRPAAIDVASGAESSPGVKDLEKIKALVAAVKESNQVS